jgi:hypothetical protein
MEKDTTPEGENCCLGSGPFLFSGQPPFIQGIVNVVNKSGERVRVQSVALEGAGLKSHGGRGLYEREQKQPDERQLDVLRVRVSKMVAPFDQANLPAQIVVDPRTPPGEYKAQLRCGDQQAEAVIFVLESHNLTLVPDRITVTAAPGETINKSIYITNEGNVPFSTRKAAFAPLQALNMLHRSLAIALNEEGHKGHEKVLDRLASELADAEVQPAKVKIDIQDQEIAPGETKRVDITVRLPADMKRKRTYTSTIRFRNARLAVEVEINDTYDKTKVRAQ